MKIEIYDVETKQWNSIISDYYAFYFIGSDDTRYRVVELNDREIVITAMDGELEISPFDTNSISFKTAD